MKEAKRVRNISDTISFNCEVKDDDDDEVIAFKIKGDPDPDLSYSCWPAAPCVMSSRILSLLN